MVHDGGGRRSSQSSIANPSSLSIAACNIFNRISPLAAAARPLNGDTAAGTKITFSRSKASRASRAKIRCP